MDELLITIDENRLIIAKPITYVESDEQYQQRINGGVFYPEDLERRIITTEEFVMFELRQDVNPVNRVFICTVDHSCVIVYPTTGFLPVSTYIDEKLVEVAHSTNLYLRTVGDDLYYYGAWLSPLRKLDPDGGNTNDIVLGLQGIPMLVATRKNYTYSNIRPYDNIGRMLFHLIGLPFTLQPDLPAESTCLTLWREVMEHLINYIYPGVGVSYDPYIYFMRNYIIRFFGEREASYSNFKSIRSYYEKSARVSDVMTTTVTDFGTVNIFHTYIYNGKPIIMTQETEAPYRRAYYIHFIEEHEYDEIDYELEDDCPTDVYAYLGNGDIYQMYYTLSGPIDIPPFNTGPDEINIAPWESRYPLWDPYNILRDEDIHFYHLTA